MELITDNSAMNWELWMFALWYYINNPCNLLTPVHCISTVKHWSWLTLIYYCHTHTITCIKFLFYPITFSLSHINVVILLHKSVIQYQIKEKKLSNVCFSPFIWLAILVLFLYVSIPLIDDVLLIYLISLYVSHFLPRNLVLISSWKWQTWLVCKLGFANG